MKFINSLLIVISVSIVGSVVFAQNNQNASCDLNSDKCSATPLSFSEQSKSLFLADHINKTLEDMYQEYKAKGQDLKIVLVARMGSDVSKFKIIDDKNGQLDLKNIIQQLKESQQYGAYDNHINQNTINYGKLRSMVNKRERLKFSHLGIAFRNMELDVEVLEEGKPVHYKTGPGTGKWSFYHLLYSCNKPENLKINGEYIKSSHIFKGTVESFFYDHLNGYDAQLIVPNQKIQDNMEDTLLKKRQVYSFQENRYNAAAIFDDLSQQNSNQFVLEAIAAAMKENGVVNSRAGAIQVLKETGYSPTKIAPMGLFTALSIPFVQNIIGNLMPSVCLKQQPELKEYGVGQVVTSNSVLNWMQRNKIVQEVKEVGLSQEQLKDLSD